MNGPHVRFVAIGFRSLAEACERVAEEMRRFAARLEQFAPKIGDEPPPQDPLTPEAEELLEGGPVIDVGYGKPFPMQPDRSNGRPVVVSRRVRRP